MRTDNPNCGSLTYRHICLMNHQKSHQTNLILSGSDPDFSCGHTAYGSIRGSTRGPRGPKNSMFYVMKLDWTSTNTNLTSSDRPLLMALDRHINSIRTRDGRPSGGKENIFTGSLLLFIINNYCRTHRVPTYPWLFLLLLI